MTEIAGIPGLHVDLKQQPGGGYQIVAQHLRDGSDYEYWLTIEPADAAAFARALDAEVSGIGDAWAAQVQQIAGEGETSWLKRHDVRYGFFSWGNPSGL